MKAMTTIKAMKCDNKATKKLQSAFQIVHRPVYWKAWTSENDYWRLTKLNWDQYKRIVTECWRQKKPEPKNKKYVPEARGGR